MQILLTGATGFLGQVLTDELLRSGHQLIIATRQSPKAFVSLPVKFISWPLNRHELSPFIQHIDAAIHLAGEPIAGSRWSDEKKEKIKNSRILGTQKITEELKLAKNLKVFISASAIGYYGDRKNEELNENSKAGVGFLAEVCKAWEGSAEKLVGPRKVILRTGVVLARKQGMLGEIETIFKFGLGSVIGSGAQYISWIHISDWVRSVIYCLEHSELSGPINLTSPEPVTNEIFSKNLAAIFKRKTFFRLPTFAIRLLMGEMADLALHSQKVLPQKLLNSTFQFRYRNIDLALEEIFRKKNNK